MITLMGTETDKLGNEIRIFNSTTLAMSPFYTFFLRQIANLIDNGFGYPFTSWEDGNCGGVYAVDSNDKILGHIVYSTEFVKTSGTLWIVLSAVDEDSRGRGIYTMMHPYFEQVAKEKGCWAISSHVHKNNKVRLASAEKVGMGQVFHYMGKKLK
jgi:GNAT superfamily N-acetyltransferase